MLRETRLLEKASTPTPVSHVWTGVLWMVLCLISFIGMALASRELSYSMPILEVLLLRSLVGVAIMLLLARRFLPELLQLTDIRLHFFRNTIHFGAQYLWTVAVTVLPLAYVFALEFTMPIWVALFAWMALGEKISRTRAYAILISFVGVLIVLSPSGGLNPAALMVLAAAAGYGASAVFVKRLTAHSSAAVIVTWMVLMQLPMSALALFLAGEGVWPSLENLPWILMLGAATLSAHYTMARALKLIDASLAIPIDFLRVPLIAAVGWVFYGESISAAVFAGAALIAAANFFAVRREAASAIPMKPEGEAIQAERATR